MPGDCHYLEGNANAKRRVEYTQHLLRSIGLEPERLRMTNLSSAMGHQFADLATRFAEEIRILGPSALRRSRPAAQATAEEG